MSSQGIALDKKESLFSVNAIMTRIQTMWSQLEKRCHGVIHSASMRESLSYCLLALTGVTGLAFGFGPMNTFLSVAEDFHGFWGSLLQCAVILPSCGFQTILWWNAYYQPAAKALDAFYQAASEKDQLYAIANKHLQWLNDDEITQLCTANKLKGQEKPRDVLSQHLVNQAINSKPESELFFPSLNLYSNQLSGAAVLVQEIVEYALFIQLNKARLSKVDAGSKRSYSAQLLDVTRWLLPRVANFLNYMTINPFGVFFAFYTALLTLSFPGVSLATLVLPSAAMPVMYTILATGYAAGFVCAFFLTRQSFKKTVHAFIDQLEERWFSEPSGVDACNQTHLQDKKILLHAQDQLRVLNRKLFVLKNKRADRYWSWLTSRPLLGMTLAVGCAISVCILNYYSGIQAAIMLSNVAALLTPGALTSAHQLMNASVAQKAFGAYSALVSVGMTSALLLNVAIEAKPQRTVDTTREQAFEKQFYWAAIAFSTLGQLFCNYVNTFKPHGIISALRLVKAPCERLFQGLFGLFSLGGTIIVTKLQAESADELLDLSKPYTSQVESKLEKPLKADKGRGWEGYGLDAIRFFSGMNIFSGRGQNLN